MNNVAVALDVGGTSIKAALVDPFGEVRHSFRRPTGADRGPLAVVATIAATATDAVGQARARGLTPVCAGVVVPAIVDEATGVAVFSANLGLRDVPLRDLVGQETGLPTALGHDVRAAALAEARLGAGRSVRRMLFLALGTGIAGGYVVDGDVDPGAHGGAGEIGHVVVRTGPEARACGCGGRGCLERYASAAAIGSAYSAAAGAPASAAEVAGRVGAGEPLAVAIWREAVEALADGVLTGVALWDPRLVVLGGGLAQAGDTLLGPLAEALSARRTFHRLPELATAELGEEAGVQGAALLALDLMGPDGAGDTR